MGGRDTDIVLLDEKGIRCDGRKINETRKVSIKAGVLKNANGSAYIEFGENKILVGKIYSVWSLIQKLSLAYLKKKRSKCRYVNQFIKFYTKM